MGKRKKGRMEVSDVVVQAKPARQSDVAIDSQVIDGERGGQCCRCGSLSQRRFVIELAMLVLATFGLWLRHDLLVAAIHAVERMAGTVPWMVMLAQ